jgi:guanylate kinase
LISKRPDERPKGKSARFSFMPDPAKGLLFIVSGPSGAGKTTLSGAALRAFPDLIMSVSCTTRPPREGENDGIDYHFVDAARFAEMIEADELAEWAEVHGNRYGTPRGPIEKHLDAGRDVLLDIDVQGAAQLRSRYPEAVAVFVLPPDRSTMESRLRGRGTDDDAVVRRRLDNACREIARAAEYDHILVNRSRDEAIGEFEEIVREAHRVGPRQMRRRRGGMSEAELAAFLCSFERSGAR